MMELKLTRITAHVLKAGTYVVDLACSFGDGGLSPHHGTLSITLSKDQIDGLTLAEIEQVATTAARQLVA